jgi:hypothetical protein
MPSPQQIEANRQNAQSSTGPTSEPGKLRSSLNSTRHGFTGQKLVLTDDEKEAYETHVGSYLEIYRPSNGEERALFQDYVDTLWSIQQINVEQSSTLSLINTLRDHYIQTGDVFNLNAALAPHYKFLHTLGIYERRRRHAAELTLAQLKQIQEANTARREMDIAAAARIHLSFKACDQPWDPQRFGFDCSIPEVEQYLADRDTHAKLEKLYNDGDKHLTDLMEYDLNS